MPIRVPPGRAGRPWLLHRLEVARRGADVLDEKRHALLREQRRTGALLDAAREEWEQTARAAAVWLERATVVAGARRFRLVAFYGRGEAKIELLWRNSLGVTHPTGATVSLPERVEPASVSGSSAFHFATEAHRSAVEAAARFAILELSFERVSRELEVTVRRLRAIDTRWIPGHEAALAALEIRLDETEREEVARVRWVLDRPSERRDP